MSPTDLGGDSVNQLYEVIKMSKQSFKTPKGDFMWAFVTGQGRKNLNGNDEFTIQVEVPEKEAKAAMDEITAFWNDNKPKGAKEPKSLGFKVVDGKAIFTLKTKTTYADGKEKEVRIFDASAKRVTMPDGVRIGNGSRGLASGIMAVYDAGVAARGVTLFLDAIQITKFVEYSEGTAGFGSEEDEGGLETIKQNQFFVEAA